MLAEAVTGGRHLTRDELAAELGRAGLLADFGAMLRGAPVRTQRTGHLLMHAELDLVLVSGAPRLSPGGALKQTYALFDERVGRGRAGARRGTGPAGAALFLQPRPRDGQGLLALVRADDGRHPGRTVVATGDGGDGALIRREFDGGTFFMAPAAGRTPRAPRADLLQCYDEMVMGYTPTRGYLQDPAPTHRALPGMPAQTGTAAHCSIRC